MSENRLLAVVVVEVVSAENENENAQLLDGFDRIHEYADRERESEYTTYDYVHEILLRGGNGA